MSDIVTRLRERIELVPKPGTEPYLPGFGEGPVITNASPSSKPGEDAGIFWLEGPYLNQKLQMHIWAVDPLCEEAAKEIERLTEELRIQDEANDILTRQLEEAKHG